MPWINFNKSSSNLKTSGGRMENCTGLAKDVSDFGLKYFDVISLEDKRELLELSQKLLKAKNCVTNVERHNMVLKFGNIKSRYIR